MAVAQPVPLSMLIEFACQKTYHDLNILAELLPHKSDMERKVEIVQFALRTRQLFVRLLALLKWSSNTKKIEACGRMLSFLNQQSTMLLHTADVLYEMSKHTFAGASLPMFAIPHAISILTTGKYNRLPSCIADQMIAPEPLTAAEKSDVTAYLTRVIQTRLMRVDVPPPLRRNLKIDRGMLHLEMLNEFRISLTPVVDEAQPSQWRVVRIKILVEEPKQRDSVLVHPVQLQFIKDLLQNQLGSGPAKPLEHVYNYLHTFCLSLQLELLTSQAEQLARSRLTNQMLLEKYQIGKNFSLTYWQIPETSWAKAAVYKLSVCVVVDHLTLSLSHEPSPVPGLSRVRSASCSVQDLLTRCYQHHARTWLGAIAEKMEPFCYWVNLKASDPPVLEVQLLREIPSSLLRIHFSPHSGTLQIYSGDVASVSTLQQLETSFKNGDYERSLNDLKTELIVSRCAAIARLAGYHPQLRLPLASSHLSTPNTVYCALGIPVYNSFAAITVRPSPQELSISVIQLTDGKIAQLRRVDKDSVLTNRRTARGGAPGMTSPSGGLEDDFNTLATLIHFSNRRSHVWQLVHVLRAKGLDGFAVVDNAITGAPEVSITDISSLSQQLPVDVGNILERILVSCTLSLIEKPIQRWQLNLVVRKLNDEGEELVGATLESPTVLPMDNTTILHINNHLAALASLYRCWEQWNNIADSFPNFKLRKFDFKELQLSYGPNQTNVVTIITHSQQPWGAAAVKFALSESLVSFPSGSGTLRNCHTLIKVELGDLLTRSRRLDCLLQAIEKSAPVLTELKELRNGISLERQLLNNPVFAVIPQSLYCYHVIYKGSSCLQVNVVSATLCRISDVGQHASLKDRYPPIAQLFQFLDSFASNGRDLATEGDNGENGLLESTAAASSTIATLGSPTTPSGVVTLADLSSPPPVAPPTLTRGDTQHYSEPNQKSAVATPAQYWTGYELRVSVLAQLLTPGEGGVSPLEHFLQLSKIRTQLASYEDPELKLAKLPKNESPNEAIIWKNAHIQVGFSLDASQKPCLQLLVQCQPPIVWSHDDITVMDQFYKQTICQQPFEFSHFTSFLRLLSLPVTVLRDWINLLRLSLNPDPSLFWRLQISTTMPHTPEQVQIQSGSPAVVIKGSKLLFVIQLFPETVAGQLHNPDMDEPLVLSFVFDLDSNRLSWANLIKTDSRIMDQIKRLLSSVQLNTSPIFSGIRGIMHGLRWGG